MNLIKSIIYKVVESATFGRGIERSFSGNRIRLPVKWARYFRTNYEPETFAFLQEYVEPGSTFLDIGAHIGIFSVAAARLAGHNGRVYSFEPTPFTRSVLTEVIRINNCNHIVEVRAEAVSDTSGTTTFFDTGDEISVANSLVRVEGTRNEIEIQTVSMDGFVDTNQITPQCIKVDVEGAELDLLVGARNTLCKLRPVVMFSVHPPFIANNGQSLESVWDLIEEYGYEMWFEKNKVDKKWFCAQVKLFDVHLIPRGH